MDENGINNENNSCVNALLGAGTVCWLAFCVATGPAATVLLTLGICLVLSSTIAAKAPEEWIDPEYPQLGRPAEFEGERGEIAGGIEASQAGRSWQASLDRSREAGRSR